MRRLAGIFLSALLQMPEAQASARDANAFAASLYGRLDTAGNLFLSPYCLRTALGMIHAGARGRTEKEMAAALRFPAGREAPHVQSEHARKLLDSLGAEGRVRIEAVNALWNQVGTPLLEPFLDVQRRRYGAEPRPVDFAGDPEAQRLLINRWAETGTDGKIPDLVPPGGIDAATRMVLGNAIYFKGKWAQPFDTAGTEDGDFRLAPGRSIRVPLMRLAGSFRYAESEGFALVELPYEGAAFSFVACLPDSSLSPARAEAAWVRGGMENALARLSEGGVRRVEGVLPRFRLTCALEASKILAGMGMASAFSPDRADFTGIAKDPGLFVSEIFHKAFVEVDEEGTEAAAATAAVVKIKGLSRPTMFRADRPFLFLIRENRTGLVLFMGRVADPRG